MRHLDAAVDGAVTDFSALSLADHNGAGAAVAFAAAFLGAGACQVLAQHLQQRAAGWYIGERDHLATPYELNGFMRLLNVHAH